MGEKVGDEFRLSRGIRQGCRLNLILFSRWALKDKEKDRGGEGILLPGVLVASEWRAGCTSERED